MCDKCSELNEKIARYRRISNFVTDKLTLEGIRGLIGRYEAEKRELHPEPAGVATTGANRGAWGVSVLKILELVSPQAKSQNRPRLRNGRRCRPSVP